MLDKNKFYEQLKHTKKYIPIYISMKVNSNSKYSINLTENRITTSKEKFSLNFTLQVINNEKSGYEKYVCKDIEFNLLNENVKTDYQLYKYVDKILKEKIGE